MSSPSLVTGDDLRPDMLISTPSNTLYVRELSVGFEANLDNNADRKFSKYRYLLNDLTSKYRHVKFVNLSIGSLGIFGQSCDSFIQMCSDLTIDKAHTNYIITKLSTIIIRKTYYTFCMRNKPWTNPDLLSKSFFSFPFLHSLFFILEIPVFRSAKYKVPIIREIFIGMFSLYGKIKFLKKLSLTPY